MWFIPQIPEFLKNNIKFILKYSEMVEKSSKQMFTVSSLLVKLHFFSFTVEDSIGSLLRIPTVTKSTWMFFWKQGSFIQYVRKIFWKANFFYPLMRTSAQQGVSNVSFFQLVSVIFSKSIIPQSNRNQITQKYLC